MSAMDQTLRETPFTREVKAVIRRIPRGRVATYGQIAALAGRERAARGVAWILHSSSEAAGLPWHRVIGGRGGYPCPGAGDSRSRRRSLWPKGVTVGRGGRIDLERYQWQPSSGVAGRSRAAKKFLREFLKDVRKA